LENGQEDTSCYCNFSFEYFITCPELFCSFFSVLDVVSHQSDYYCQKRITL